MSTPPITSIDVTQQESCLLTLNYAWYHVIGCSLQMLLLWGSGRTQFFTASNNFGIFAMLADYGNMHLVKGTRTLEVVRQPTQQWGDVDHLNGVDTFFFFLWFDYWGAVALLVFARHVIETVYERKITLTSLFVIVFQSTMWWTAPSQSHLLGWDDRQLLLARDSPKFTYIGLLLAFTLLLHFHQKVSLRRYLSILAGGVACGLLHHLALFVHGMRGYHSIPHLLLTLCTEWPALLCAEAYIRNHAVFNNYGRILQRSMLVLLLAMMIPHLPTVEQATEYMIALVPGHIMQTIGTFFFRVQTCWLPSPSTLDCGNKDNEVWLLSTASKSGAVISAKLLLDIATTCGYCVASGSRTAAGIPGLVHNPTYRGQLLHAADMEEWPLYTGNDYKCITMTRDPLRRLRSFYTYTRSGGEHWVRVATNFTKTVRQAPTLEESIQLFWDRAGKEYLQSSHAMFQTDLTTGRQCTEVRFDDLMADFQGTLQQIVSIFGASEEAIEPLVQRMMRHDRSTTRAELLAKDPHASSSKFTKEFLKQVDTIMEKKNVEIANMIQTQRQEMVEWRRKDGEEE